MLLMRLGKDMSENFQRQLKVAFSRLRGILATNQLDPDAERAARRVLRELERAMVSGEPDAIRAVVARYAAFFLRKEGI